MKPGLRLLYFDRYHTRARLQRLLDEFGFTSVALEVNLRSIAERERRGLLGSIGCLKVCGNTDIGKIDPSIVGNSIERPTISAFHLYSEFAELLSGNLQPADQLKVR